jgi:hypothetical protein
MSLTAHGSGTSTSAGTSTSTNTEGEGHEEEAEHQVAGQAGRAYGATASEQAYEDVGGNRGPARPRPGHSDDTR